VGNIYPNIPANNPHRRLLGYLANKLIYFVLIISY